jgi:arabinofuranosyltransferase
MFVANKFQGMKLIELLRNHALSFGSPVHYSIGFVELEMIGTYAVILGMATIMLALLSRMLRQARVVDGIMIAIMNVFSIYFILNAYVCDDAFITFRTVDNFFHGYGLRWNTIERVQTYTNPLWMFLVSAGYAIAHIVPSGSDITKMYFTAMFLSYAVSLSAILVAVGFANRESRPGPVLTMLAVLFSSRAFVEYTSSGLENPLIYLLLALFHCRFLVDREPQAHPRLIYYFLIASFAFVNRIDSVILFAAPVAWLVFKGFRTHGHGMWRTLALGFLPACAWLLFAMAYYGFPFPNSYYAKLGMGSSGVVLMQGVNFVLSVLTTDPVTVIAIIAAIIMTILRQDKRMMLVSVGLPLSVIYAIRTGGDFMGGRFFSGSLFLSGILLAHSMVPAVRAQSESAATSRKRKITPARSDVKRRLFAPAVILLFLAYSVWAPLSPIKTPLLEDAIHRETLGFQYFDLPNSLTNIYKNADYYVPSNPLFYSKGPFPFGNTKFHGVPDCWNCAYFRGTTASAIVEGGGLQGICRGPLMQLIDPQGITDPLIARLPAPDISGGFIPGHISKTLPAGMVESYITGRNLISDPKLSEYFGKLCSITRGPIFSFERFMNIFELNLPGNRRYGFPYQ